MEITRPTVMEIDLRAFKHNVEQIKKYIGNDVKIMPVIKANAYGTWINFRNDMLEQFDIVAVALVDEAVKLRENGFQKEIFVLNQPYESEIEKIIKYNITIGISEYTFLKKICEQNEKIKVHIEIETGMGRTGVNLIKLKEFSNELKQNSNIIVEGIYTHLSSADYDTEYTNMQLEKFREAVNVVENIFGKLKYVHCSASNGILNYKDSYYNLVRAGIILYGYECFDNTLQMINLKPICKLKSKITFLKEVEPGTSIGYARKFIADKKRKIATIPIGYADGFKRTLSNNGEVVINGWKVPIVGNICMDSFMADVSELSKVSVGDDVYIWDNEIITIEDIARRVDSINYEIMCTVSDRIPRVFGD